MTFQLIIIDTVEFLFYSIGKGSIPLSGLNIFISCKIPFPHDIQFILPYKRDLYLPHRVWYPSTSLTPSQTSFDRRCAPPWTMVRYLPRWVLVVEGSPRTLEGQENLWKCKRKYRPIWHDSSTPRDRSVQNMRTHYKGKTSQSLLKSKVYCHCVKDLVPKRWNRDDCKHIKKLICRTY